VNLEYYQHIAKKVLEGVAGNDEKAELQAFIEAHQHDPAIMQALLPIQELESMPAQPLPAAMEQRVLSGIPAARPQKISRRALWLRASAAAAILLFVCYTAYLWYGREPRKPMSPSYTSVVTRPGEHLLVTLPDGSQALLNGNSRLAFPPNFSPASRSVFLEGEAFFTISQDERRPFLVRTNTLSTKVLGTSFNVRSFRQENTTQVAVATGKVQVTLAGHAALDLTPGQRVSYRLHDAAGLRMENVDLAMIGAWKDRSFFYEQTPLRQILADLESVYGLRFKVADTALLHCTYTARFSNLTANSILNSLARLGAVHFAQKDSLITVSGKPCQQ
jgi:ferric-dicitrate binding protein FerR (iron transport regulator)